LNAGTTAAVRTGNRQDPGITVVRDGEGVSTHAKIIGHVAPLKAGQLSCDVIPVTDETGVSGVHAGLRKTLRPDPDHAGVGSFRQRRFTRHALVLSTCFTSDGFNDNRSSCFW
jgi:hypothetical protein